ncbi:Retrovirus-related Pol polyprotein from transposon TNT 1-94 [Gossypium australe]|uniref:Retrovirus-related Pol polyprotein from transposon TNT 1-94 n=1 Tax=Gossypium australe TaxID=47621 RepID=A0A5B6WPQ8_9ROSI|nr:Retrovirus-related Pol polyprotein from transposon TNT 1-94 [Gossypium australe]
MAMCIMNQCQLKNVGKEMIDQNRKKQLRRICTPEGVKPMRYKWVFMRKRNEKGEIVSYKTYSLVVDETTFRFLISLVIREGLDLHLMDVVIANLYGPLDNNIYMKPPEGFKLPEAANSCSREYYSIKLNISFYGLKQFGRMWHNRLNEYLSNEGYKNDPISPCIFIKKFGSGFVIIVVYVDDLNIIGTFEEILVTMECLNKEFEIKDLGKTRFCLRLQIEHLNNGIFLHQTTYI